LYGAGTVIIWDKGRFKIKEANLGLLERRSITCSVSPEYKEPQYLLQIT